MTNAGGNGSASGRARAHEDLGVEILGCNVCFEGEHAGTVRHCWHHEDVLGGYGPGRILVLIINAQRPVDLEWDPPAHVLDPRTSLPRSAPRGAKARALATYRAIRDGDPTRKLRFADEGLRIFATGEAGEFTEWVEDHPGQRDWLPRATRLLLGDAGAGQRALLAQHFVFLDVYKHATADAAQLGKAVEDHPSISDCPRRWLPRQLAELEPAMILLCGKPVIAKAVDLWPFRDAQDRPLDHTTPMADLHGARWRGWLQGARGPETETWTTYAISGQTEDLFWPKAPDASDALRAAIRVAMARRA